MGEAHYTQANVDNHSVYLSDRSENRVSNAMMIATPGMPNGLPSVPTSVTAFGNSSAEHQMPMDSIRRFHNMHNRFLAAALGRPVPSGSRALLNWQRYGSGSRAVAEHFDGEYLKYVKKSPTEFELVEGILPRYVFVLTIANENKAGDNPGGVTGTVLRDINTGATHAPPSEPGDLLVFDNIRFRHSVPELAKPRRMVGLRSWDHMGVHFVKDLAHKIPSIAYEPIPEGWISSHEDIGFMEREDFDSVRRQLGFMRPSEWQLLREYQKSTGAVF
jgi:hypothetical protein